MTQTGKQIIIEADKTNKILIKAGFKANEKGTYLKEITIENSGKFYNSTGTF